MSDLSHPHLSEPFFPGAGILAGCVFSALGAVLGTFIVERWFPTNKTVGRALNNVLACVLAFTLKVVVLRVFRADDSDSTAAKRTTTMYMLTKFSASFGGALSSMSGTIGDVVEDILLQRSSSLKTTLSGAVHPEDKPSETLPLLLVSEDKELNDRRLGQRKSGELTRGNAKSVLAETVTEQDDLRQQNEIGTTWDSGLGNLSLHFSLVVLFMLFSLHTDVFLLERIVLDRRTLSFAREVPWL